MSQKHVQMSNPYTMIWCIAGLFDGKGTVSLLGCTIHEVQNSCQDVLLCLPNGILATTGYSTIVMVLINMIYCGVALHTIIECIPCND